MNDLKEKLSVYNFKINSLKYIGKVIIIDTTNGKYIYKNGNNYKIYEYLESRGFNYFPKPINSKDTTYELTPYVKELITPDEQRINDLVNLVSFLHEKTFFYKELDLDELKTMYENLNSGADYLMKYYNDLNNIIDNTTFMSPSEYLLVRNIDLFYYLISFVKVESTNWYNNLKDKRSIRYSMVHNNLKPSHILENNTTYLISWNKARIDLPYKDLKTILEDNYSKLDIENIIKSYVKNNKLDKNEYIFLLINLALPKKIEFTSNTCLDCYNLSNYIEYLRKIEVLVQKIDSKVEKI